MRPHVWNFTPADDNLTGFASNVTGATFTITTTTPDDGMAHLVIVTNDSITDHSGKTMALVGTDADGNAQTETLTGPAASTTSTSTRYFRTLTSANPSATIGADTFDIGWTDDAVSPTFVPDYKQAPFNLGIGCDIAGTINYDIQHTFDNVFETPTTSTYSARTWFDHSSIAAKTADADGNYAAPIRGIRILINSLTSGATIKVTLIQSGV